MVGVPGGPPGAGLLHAEAGLLPRAAGEAACAAAVRACQMRSTCQCACLVSDVQHVWPQRVDKRQPLLFSTSVQQPTPSRS